MKKPTEVKKDLGPLSEVPVKLTVTVGETTLSFQQLSELAIGTVYQLEEYAGEDVSVLANGVRIATGKIVCMNEHYGVRITKVLNEGEDNG